jgi:hypothetical protein
MTEMDIKTKLQSRKNLILAAGCLIALGSIGTVMNRGSSPVALRADGGPTVTIGSPIPLPVTGGLTISGTPSVNVANTPNVNVNNTPNVHVTNSPTVQVGNTSANPVPTTDRDATGRNLYQAVSNCSNVPNPCVIAFPAVPAGKRLVITHVSALAVMPSATALVVVELRGGNIFQFLPSVASPGNFTGQFDSIVNQEVLAAYEVGQTPEVDGFAATVSTFTVVASISGYMIDVP